MTPTQRDLILAALGLTPRDGRMPRLGGDPLRRKKIEQQMKQLLPVAVAAAEAAGVLGRVRKEDLGR